VTIDLVYHPTYGSTEMFSSCNPADTGTVMIPLLSVYGCDSLITIITSLDVLASGSATMTICNGDSTTVNGSDYYDATGIYTDTISGFSCDSVVTLDLTVDNPPNTAPSQTLCPGDSFSLDGIDYYDTTGVYVITVPGTGCDTIVTLSLTVKPYAQGQSIVSLCGNDSISINGSQYYNSSGVYADTIPGFECDSIVLLNLTVNQTDSVFIQDLTCDINSIGSVVQLYNNTAMCDSVVTITTSLSPIGIVSVTPSDANCDGLNGSVDVVMGTGVAPYQYDVSGPSPQSSGSSPIQSLDAGTYILTVTDSVGCSVSQSFVVDQPAQFSFDATPEAVTLLYGESYDLEVTPVSGQVLWTPSTFLSCDTCEVTTTTPEYSLYYIVSGEENGCLAYDTVQVEVIQPDLLVPTAFTPNGDGSNDEFHVIDKYIDELIYLRVFNRWGELVFETNDLSHGWDGRFKGEEQEMDSYIVHVLAILYTGRVADVTGNVLLLR